MSDEGYIKLMKQLIVKKQQAIGEHEFKVASADMRLLVKHNIINGVDSTMIDHPEIKLSEDVHIQSHKYNIARCNYNIN